MGRSLFGIQVKSSGDRPLEHQETYQAIAVWNTSKVIRPHVKSEVIQEAGEDLGELRLSCGGN